MFYNQVSLITLFALFGIGASLLLLGIGAQFMVDIQGYYDRSDGELLAGVIFSFVGAVTLLLSIALIMRMHWARIALQILLIIAGFGWIIFLYFISTNSQQAWFALSGMAAVGLAGVIFGLLFLGNHQVLNEFEEISIDRIGSKDILDHRP